MILFPSRGPDDWRGRLADPVLHWKPGKSAFECATSWETARRTARGLPPIVATALDLQPSLAQAHLLVAIPELQVYLPGGGHPSQNDVWALLKGPEGTISLAVEAKSGEPFGPLVGERLAKAPPNSGVPARLQYLRSELGLDNTDVSKLRYQLLHRAVSALVQADRFGATGAVLLVQSFGGKSDDRSRDDYCRFAEALDCAPAFDFVVKVGRPTSHPFFIGWLADAPSITSSSIT